MGDRLNRYRQRSQAESRDRGSENTARYDFCVNELPALARRAIDAIDGREQAEGNHQVLECRNERGETDEYAAWMLGDWPPHDLPRELQGYSVFVLEDARIVSRSHFWSGETVTVPYNPNLHATQALNVQSIYAALAYLPRDYYFEKENMDRIPS